MTISETTYTATGVVAEQNVTRLNGVGDVRREEALGAGGVWDAIDTVYDNLNRVSQQSRPYRSGVQTPQWVTFSYDSLGRLNSVQSPDGSTTQNFYNEVSRPDVATAGTPAGQTKRVVDPWGRERWGRADALGRLVEVVEPNPGGNGSVQTGGLLTTYSYNTLGNLTAIAQGGQTRAFRYDSVGRITHQRLAEARATLNDAGQYVSAGQWSDVTTYDDRSNVTSNIDARGIKTVYGYNNDPLNRLQSVSYDTTGFGDTAYPVVAAPTVNYSYMTTGDVTRLNSVNTTGVATDSYGYDTREGSARSLKPCRAARPSDDDRYIYDTLDRVVDARFLRNMASEPRRANLSITITTRRAASARSRLTVSLTPRRLPTTQPASRFAQCRHGRQPITESYNFNAATGLLDNQTWRAERPRSSTSPTTTCAPARTAGARDR